MEQKSGVNTRTLVWVLGIGTLAFIIAASPALYSSITGRATSSSFTVNITIGNTAPNIVLVQYNDTVSVSEGNMRAVYINFTANDSDGYANLQDSTASVSLIHYTGSEPSRQNTSCVKLSNHGTAYANYTCTLYLSYFDAAGQWVINASVQDASSTLAVNSTANFTYEELSAFVKSPASLAFPGVTPGNTNVTASSSMTLNNTGNKPITLGNVQLNATNLAGEANPSLAIYAANFSVGTNTGSYAECDTSTGANNATTLAPAIFTPLNLTTLPKGNNSLGYYNETSGQERIYFCIKKIGSELSSQSYSTSVNGAWTLKII